MKPDVLNKFKTGLQMASIGLDLKENLVPFSDIKQGFGVKTVITKKRKDSVTNQGVAKFKREGERFLTSVVKKLFEESLVKCDIVRFCSIFDPAVILSCEAKVLQKRFKSLLNQFMISDTLSNQIIRFCHGGVHEFY